MEEFQNMYEKYGYYKKLCMLLRQNESFFKVHVLKGLSPKRQADHKNEAIPGKKMPFRKLYQPSPAELMAAKHYIEEIMEANKIQPSKSLYHVPMLFANEKTEKLRGFVDYRALSRITKKNDTAVRRTTEIFDRLGNTTDVFKTTSENRLSSN